MGTADEYVCSLLGSNGQSWLHAMLRQTTRKLTLDIANLLHLLPSPHLVVFVRCCLLVGRLCTRLLSQWHGVHPCTQGRYCPGKPVNTILIAHWAWPLCSLEQKVLRQVSQNRKWLGHGMPLVGHYALLQAVELTPASSIGTAPDSSGTAPKTDFINFGIYKLVTVFITYCSSARAGGTV